MPDENVPPPSTGEPHSEPTQYIPPQSEPPQYTQPQYTQPQYTQPQYTQPYPHAPYSQVPPGQPGYPQAPFEGQQYSPPGDYWQYPTTPQGDYAYADPNQPWGLAPAPPPVPPRNRSRRGLVLAMAGVGVIVLVVAVVNMSRSKDNATNQPDPFQTFSFSFSVPTPGPSSSGGTQGGGGLFGKDSDGTAIPAVFCPIVRDEKSHLSYRCIDDGLVQDGADTYLGLRISLNEEVETGWVVSEGSGNPESIARNPNDSNQIGWLHPAAAPAAPSAADIENEVRRRADRALQAAYGDKPTSKVLSEGVRKVDGVDGFELNLEITINPYYRSHRPDNLPTLKTKKERLWIVGVPTKAGVSIFMLSIPDLRKDLWPKAEDTIDTIKII